MEVTDLAHFLSHALDICLHDWASASVPLVSTRTGTVMALVPWSPHLEGCVLSGRELPHPGHPHPGSWGLPVCAGRCSVTFSVLIVLVARAAVPFHRG